jgi:butyrate kinase
MTSVENNMKRLLIINPGSTSTKVAVFHDAEERQTRIINHTSAELQKYNSIIDQLPFRIKTIRRFLREKGFEPDSFDAFVGRGGLLRPIPGGTYRINQPMVDDLRSCRYGSHASNLGALIAYQFATEVLRPAFVVDPVVVDELDPVARITGLPDIEKRSIFHALNQKSVAKRFAGSIGRVYDELTLIVAHMGGGISVGCHRKGRVVEVNNALNGTGPFSPERAGTVQAGQWTERILRKRVPESDAIRMLSGRGGLVAHLGTSDTREVQKRISEGDEQARLVYDAMIYNIAREIGAASIAARGLVDGIILTGGIAHSDYVTGRISEYVRHIAPVHLIPGENEMLALAEGAFRVLSGLEAAQDYNSSEAAGIESNAGLAVSRN